jgi:DNA mismatch repair protein MutS
MRQQYQEIKAQYEDCILFFRLGDFYEMFEDDARLASQELELTLTTRDRNKENPEERVPMCGVPYHASEAYIARLIAKGYKVAICEQTEDPALAKGLVTRDVIRVVTPGTLIDSSMLDEGRNNFLGAIYLDQASAGVCFCDISTGEVFVTGFSGDAAAGHVVNELGRFSPREVVLSAGAMTNRDLTYFLGEQLSCRFESGKEESFLEAEARDLAARQFPDGGLDELLCAGPGALRAVGGLLSFLYETQKTDLSYVNTLLCYGEGQFMELDYGARRNLELTETIRGKEKKGSLLWVLDRTKTPMGRRLIRGWVVRPLLGPVPIRRRLDAVGELVDQAIGREELILALREITDLERLIGKVVYGSANCRDLKSLSSGCAMLPALLELLSPFQTALLRELFTPHRPAFPTCAT